MNQQNNRRFYALLKEHGLQEEKANVALQATNGRSESSKDITDAEATALFEKFEFTYNAFTPSVSKPVDDKKQRQMGKLFFTFRKAGFYNEKQRSPRRVASSLSGLNRWAEIFPKGQC